MVILPSDHQIAMKIGTEELLLILMSSAFFVQLIYFLFFFIRIGPTKHTPLLNSEYPPVSVIICARSESSKLIEHLPHIFDQDYPDFEVVVVNDRSWDDTKEILKAFQVKYPQLRVINIEESSHEHFGKKMALTIGIKGAKNEWLLLTDADCKPNSVHWLRKMTEARNEKTELVLGYSPYKKEKGLLNKIIRFDTFWAGLHYLSFAKAGLPYMGVGRNLMYRKDVFFRLSGFKKHYHISSGDDDLFVNEAAHSSNTSIQTDVASHVFSLPKKSFIDWFRQKKRHFTTSPHYKFIHKLLLSLFPLSLLLFLVSGIASVVLNKYILITLLLFGIRMLLQLAIFSRSMRVLGDKDLLIWAPFLEFILLVLHPAIHVSNKIVKADKWN